MPIITSGQKLNLRQRTSATFAKKALAVALQNQKENSCNPDTAITLQTLLAKTKSIKRHGANAQRTNLSKPQNTKIL